jgi:hypothetical protein
MVRELEGTPGGYFEILSRQSPGETEESYGKTLSDYPVTS